jgi:probable rRNA maturation factor
MIASSTSIKNPASMTSAKTMSKMTLGSFDFFNETKAKIPLRFRRIFLRMKNTILGKKYELSVAIVGTSKICQLNRRWRDKDKPTDILSFPLSETEGEIYINPAEAKKEAKKFDRTYDNFILFLFIHGLVHLKGYEHGVIMESIEKKFRKKFGV